MSGGFTLGGHQAPGFSDTTVTGTDASMALVIEGFTYEDLYDPARLAALHEAFDGWFAAHGSEMYRRFDEYRRTQGEGMTPLQQSDALLAAAPFVGQFIGRLFRVESSLDEFRQSVRASDPIWRFRKDFLKKRVLRAD